MDSIKIERVMQLELQNLKLKYDMLQLQQTQVKQEIENKLISLLAANNLDREEWGVNIDSGEFIKLTK